MSSAHTVVAVGVAKKQEVQLAPYCCSPERCCTTFDTHFLPGHPRRARVLLLVGRQRRRAARYGNSGIAVVAPRRMASVPAKNATRSDRFSLRRAPRACAPTGVYRKRPKSTQRYFSFLITPETCADV